MGLGSEGGYSKRNFLKFSSKKCTRKTTYDQKPGPGDGAYNQPRGAEDIKRKGVENLAGGSTPLTPPPSTRILGSSGYQVSK